MIVEKRTYTLRPGGAPEYMALYEEYGLETQREILGNMVGWYYPEMGELNQIIHMWAFKDFADRTRRRARMHKNKKWQIFLTKLRASGLIVSQENQILNPAPWCPGPKL